MAYNHPITGTKNTFFNSHEEAIFYDNTSKREMFLIIEQLSELAKSKNQNWVDRAKEERELIQKFK